MKIKEETYDLTVYKVDSSKSLEDYQEIFTLLLSSQKYKDKKDNNIFKYNDETEILYFSYVNSPDQRDIEWHKEWCTFFDIKKALRSNSETGHGVILVHDKVYDNIFALVFGRAAWLIREYFEFDFGVYMAARLFDGTAIDAISSKYFSLLKNKSIIAYKEQTRLQPEEGQAVDFLEAIISEDYARRPNQESQYINELLNSIKNYASASYSYLKITLYGKSVTLDILVKAIMQLSLVRSYDPRFEFPLMKKVDRIFGESLDEILLQKLKDGSKDFFVGIPWFGLDESDKYAFFGNIDKYYFRYGSTFSIESNTLAYAANVEETAYTELNVDVISQFIRENQGVIEEIRKLKILMYSEGQRLPVSELMKWLDVELEYEGKTYALYNGFWVEFNDKYIECLDNKVREIEKLCYSYKPEFSFTKSEFIEFRENNLQALLEAYSEKGDSDKEKIYREFVYNYILSRKTDWRLFDRTCADTIEICDINVKNEQYIHVKVGQSQSIEAVLRQSIFGIKYVSSATSQRKIIRNKYKERLTKAKQATIIFLSEYNVDEKKISELSSLKCKMTFVDWYVYVQEHMMKPVFIEANYRVAKLPETPIWNRLDSLTTN